MTSPIPPTLPEAKHLTETEITDWWGPRCNVFEPGCCVCRAWVRHDIIAAMAEEDEGTRREIGAICD